MRWENSLHYMYAPSCVSFFHTPNCINAPPKVILLNASSCILYFLHKRARDITENYYKRFHYHRPCKPKAAIIKGVSFSDIFTTVIYSKYQRIDIGIKAHAIYIYVEQQPITGIPIQHIMRWPHFNVFRKTPKQFCLIHIYNRFIFYCMCKNWKDTKHLNKFSRCIKTIRIIIQSIIYKIIHH